MTQDNTPPGPIFKSRLLRTKHDTQYQTTRVSESCRFDLSKDALFGTDERFDVDQSRFENRSRGCVILCHLRQRYDDGYSMIRHSSIYIYIYISKQHL